MRNELELIATIEKYLNNEMSAEEKAAFEKNMAADPHLQEAVALQQEVMQGINNLHLKQKIQLARKRYYRHRNLTRWGLTGLVIIITIISILYYLRHHHTYKEKHAVVELNEQGQQQWADADKRLIPQVFVINAGNDTIVETKGGLVIQVPANGFLDENKQPVTGKMELIIKEAMDAASIMRAGLSSTFGIQLLESAGMFFVDARKDGKIISINPATGLYIERPTDTLLPGMKLFKGNRLADGRIDWVNPKPLEQDLTPVDINLLNFYPPGYLDSLAKWGYNYRNKKFTDSLYYSFSDLFLYPSYLEEEGEDVDNTPKYKHTPKPCGINPARIKAIWSNKFQNTLLATREFEERLRYIYKTDDNKVLDLYVNNLDKKLSDIDSMVTRLITGTLKQQFLVFAARHDGKVKISSILTQKLRQYYETKTSIFMEAVAKTNREFWNKQMQMDSLINERQVKHQKESQERTSRLFKEELDLNLKNVYHQLGYDTGFTPRIPTNKVYKVAIRETGWYNIDRFVNEETATRTSGNYTDPKTGKTATIKYQPVSFLVNKQEQFDTLFVYLLPDKLSSFMRLTQVNGRYAENLNEQIKYKLVCIACKGGRMFYYLLSGIEPKVYTEIELVEISQNELTRVLNREGSAQQESDVQKELAFFRFYNNDVKRQKRNAELEELRWRMFPIIYHCMDAK
ncbi:MULTISPECIES: hypothetical protein [Niastella]|uniref:Uncharacterized protein n=1 Tax=Niastella soli TaxID=2821487 RepID=A0ABS3Z0N4_9BACT|nr:hypothetical protein [Niastella soli]MBO9203717.1 hypothetical protein [Niastella soli]